MLEGAPAGSSAVDRMHLLESSLPYELLALEAALAAHTKGLEGETDDLECQAKPSLEHLLSSVSMTQFTSAADGACSCYRQNRLFEAQALLSEALA